MQLLVICLLVICLLLFVLKVVSFFISEKVVLSREELSSYECGFEHYGLSRVPFSFRYFFLTLLFLLFDLEIVLMIFFPFVVSSVGLLVGAILVVSFLLILYGSLIYEWVDGTLEWVN